KAASLLAYLAYYRHQAHPREVLMEMLWPDCDPDTGRNRLSTALWSLRRQLEPPGTFAGNILQADRFAVSLNPAAITTDVAAFKVALRNAARATDRIDQVRFVRAALDLYRGEMLPGFYEDWLLTERERLVELHGRATRWLRNHQEQNDDLG